jgi:hypothetical protein
VDSQDLAGVDKTIVRGCPVFLFGVQREANEIKRSLANVPAGVAKPRPQDIATLGLGQFFACWGQHVRKVYVRPAWMSDGDARAVAVGEYSPGDIRPPQTQTNPAPRAAAPVPQPRKDDEEMSAKDIADLKEGLAELTSILRAQARPAAAPPPTPPTNAVAAPGGGDAESVYQYVRDRLLKDPAVIKVLAERPKIEVDYETPTINADGATLFGRIARLLAAGFADESKTNGNFYKELKRTGPDANTANIGRELDKFVRLGFVTREADGYRVAQDMKKNIRQK